MDFYNPISYHYGKVKNMIDNIKVYGYNVRIIDSDDKQNIKITTKIGDPRVTKETMYRIYKYLVCEGFITHPLYPI